MKRPMGTPPSLRTAMSLPPSIVYFVCFVYFGRTACSAERAGLQIPLNLPL
jgi:hypothetical protein